VGNQVCDNQVVKESLPVPYFGDIANQNLKVVTIGLNPALDEFYKFNGDEKPRSQRLALLSDYKANNRKDLNVGDLDDVKKRRSEYFRDPNRDWHNYFQKMELVINRANQDWSYFSGSAMHLDIVACATKRRWSDIVPEAKALMIGNCREHFLESLAELPNGTILLFDGLRVMQEMQNLGLPIQRQPTQLMNLRSPDNGDSGWLGNLTLNDKTFPFRGWSSNVSQLSMCWRLDLATWLRYSFRSQKN
jgi:hypothetical protein